VGLALLILFQLPLWHDAATEPGAVPEARTLGRILSDKLSFPVTFAVPAVILAQFMVACAFAVRTIRVTFDQIDPRHEQVALMLGENRSEAFRPIVLSEARRGMVTALHVTHNRAEAKMLADDWLELKDDEVRGHACDAAITE